MGPAKSCAHIGELKTGYDLEGKSIEDYLDDMMLRSAVERQLMIIGEAFNQANKIDETKQ